MTTTLTPHLDLDAIATRAEAATRGPWWLGETATIDKGTLATTYHVEQPGGRVVKVQSTREDAELVAHARQDIASLLAEVSRLRDAVKVAGQAANAEADARAVLARQLRDLETQHVDALRTWQADTAELAATVRELTTELEEARAPAACDMKQGEPYDFAWCETHDATFPLGAACKFNGRQMWEVFAEEADQQRQRAVRVELTLEAVQRVLYQGGQNGESVRRELRSIVPLGGGQ